MANPIIEVADDDEVVPVDATDYARAQLIEAIDLLIDAHGDDAIALIGAYAMSCARHRFIQ